MNTNILIAAFVGVAAISVAIFAYSQNMNMPSTQTMAEQSMPNVSTQPINSITEPDDLQPADLQVVANGSYIDYNANNLTDNNNVIFFAASWCPTCRVLDSAILQNLNSIPAGLTILKADYDKEKSLKQKYGVTYQHTLVQVNANGDLITKWNGSENIQQIVEQLK